MLLYRLGNTLRESSIYRHVGKCRGYHRALEQNRLRNSLHCHVQIQSHTAHCCGCRIISDEVGYKKSGRLVYHSAHEYIVERGLRPENAEPIVDRNRQGAQAHVGAVEGGRV